MALTRPVVVSRQRTPSSEGGRGSRRAIIILVAATAASNGVLLVLPFFTQFDASDNVYLASLVTGASPAFQGLSWPGGFFALSMFVPSFLTYTASGFNLVVSAYWMKGTSILFTFLTALILRRIATQRGMERPDSIFWLTMLNPAVLFVNLVWVEPDMFAVFLVTLSYYLLRYYPRRTETLSYALVALLPLFVATFYYYYPLLLLPALVLFAATRRARLVTIGAAAVLTGSFFLVQDVAFRPGFAYLSALDSGVIGPHSGSAIQGLQYFVPLTTPVYLVALLLLAVGLPLVLWWRRIPECIVLGLILLLFVYTSIDAYPDNFLWPLPFLSIFLVQRTSLFVRAGSYLITNIFVLTGIAFENLLAGWGLTFGIYYWGYYLFHARGLYITSPEQYTRILQAYNASLAAALLIVVLYIFVEHSRDSVRSGPTPAPGSGRAARSLQGDPPPVASAPARSWRVGRHPSARVVGLAVGVVVLLGLTPVFADNYGSLTSGVSVANAPTALLIPGVLPGYVWTTPDERVSYLTNGPQITFESQAPPLVLYRNLTTQSISLSAALGWGLGPNISGTYEAFYTSDLSGTLNQVHRIATSTLSPVSPNDSYDVAPPQTISLPIFDVPVSVFSFAPVAVQTFALGVSGAPRTFVFGFRLSAQSSSDVILATLLTSTVKIQLDAYFGSAFLYVDHLNNGTGSLSPSIEYSNATLDGWNLAEITLGPTTFLASVDGHELRASELPGPSNSTLLLGNPYRGPSVPLQGQFSELFAGTGVTGTTSDSFVIERGGETVDLVNLSADRFSLSLDSAENTTVGIDGAGYGFNVETTWLSIGKVTPGSYALNVTFESISLSPRSELTIYLYPVFWAVVGPFLLTAAYCLIPLQMGRRTEEVRRPEPGSNATAPVGLSDPAAVPDQVGESP